MAILSSYSLPAFIQDFAEGSAEDIALKDWWNINITGWIAQAMPAPPSFFYAPNETDIPQGTQAAKVEWVAFPGRLDQYFSASPPNSPANPYKLTTDQVYALADSGYYQAAGGVTSFPDIPANLCPQADWSGPLQSFGPYGPRGWLDEYCEWSSTRDASGNLVRVDFACENPEYWNTLWKVSPDRVRELYEQTLNYDAPTERQIAVSLDDLILTANGQPVIDPDTGNPAYNPLNKWNSGPASIRNGDSTAFAGGVMHLTSTPNTLQTELGLAGAATAQYASGNSDPQALICCGHFGQAYRHSDPHIGQSVCQIVGGEFAPPNNYRICLADPVGLYLQNLTNPSAFGFAEEIDPSKLPANAQASDVFQVIRGSPVVTDPVTGSAFNGQMNLHIVCQIPSPWLAAYPTMTLHDIVINGQPIQWAGQIANQFQVGLYARPLLTNDTPPRVACVNTAPTAGAPLQCMHLDLFEGYNANTELAPTGVAMPLLSNSTMIAPHVVAGSNSVMLVLTMNNPSSQNISISFLDANGQPDPDIQIRTHDLFKASYAIPGNSYPGNYAAVTIEVSVDQTAQPGLRAVSVTDPQGGVSTLMAAIYVKSRN